MTLEKLTVSVYLRHSASCGRKDDPYWRRCRCPKWLSRLLLELGFCFMTGWPPCH